MGKYIDLRCDFGFKYCMSDPIIMKSFLNALLEGDVEKITSVTFENVEMPRDTINQRGVTFDLHCTTETGDTILIEMQNSYQKFFKTRANFYIFNLMSKKIRRGMEWGKMENDITRIIGIFIMGDGLAGLDDAITCTAECNVKTGEIFWDRHRKYFINLPKFKFDDENITTKDIWINFFKNLGDMDKIHKSVYERADEGLLRLLEKAKVAALTDEERDVYEASMKRLEDEVDMEELGYKIGMEEGLDIGRKEGREEGRKEGREEGREEGEHNKAIQIATDMKQEGLDSALIAKLTNLSLEEIEKL
ncbi:MAG: Rpn family recombination-promoting nuclease/putative transposase [Paludibacteraceae bacterium]|nr:Rpn family recombination-promoting nuclease/putative transposase [Paludibacteraceae bacterium]